MNRQHPTNHSMQRRMATHNYALPGIYHVTLHVTEGMGQPLGQIEGALEQPEESHDSPRMVLTGFKKGCNRHSWAMTGQDAPTGEPLDTMPPAMPVGSPAVRVSGGSPAGINKETI